MTACSPLTEKTIIIENEPLSEADGGENEVKNEPPSSTEEEILLEKSVSLLSSLEHLKWEEITEISHPDGVVFSSFANIGSFDAAEVVLAKEELTGNDHEILWGHDLLSGKEITATKANYVDKYLFHTIMGEPVNYETVTYNSSSVNSGGTLNTISENYPDAKYVEYYSKATDESGVTWQAMRFVFKEHQEEWLLYAIVRDVHSP